MPHSGGDNGQAWAGQYDLRFPGQKIVLKNGWQTVEVTVPANSTRNFDWKARDAAN